MEQCGNHRRAGRPAIARATGLLPVALCFAWVTPAVAAPADGDTVVTVNRGVNIVKNSDLEFGDYIAGTARSHFRINPNTGALIQRNGNAISVGGTQSVASFTAFGTPLLRVRLTVTDNRIFIVRDGGTETMRVNRFRLDGRRNRFLNAAGEVEYKIGGQLRINPNQAAGTYRGTFNVTIDYQ
ncbi:hypothetical protein MNBD_ALPHA04-2312 [hydrothermal vent metagenome]|uniref:DUF4402 domain-containing protein n=1 Tax=hydrothermal vent metagenome TaxID=652676 RepID=A0A3B0S6P4_9ZZZZ